MYKLHRANENKEMVRPCITIADLQGRNKTISLTQSNSNYKDGTNASPIFIYDQQHHKQKEAPSYYYAPIGLE